MHAALPLRFTCTLPRRCMQVFVVHLRFSGDDGKQDRLQPGGRLSAAILPLVSRGSWTAKDADKIRRGNLGNGFLEGHGEILPQKKKCAMQNNACNAHKRGYSSRMSNTTLQAPKGGELHNLSDKFYLGGQFMPPQDKLVGAKRKANEKAGAFRYNAVEVIGVEIYVHQVIRDVPSIYEPVTITRLKKVAKGKTPEEAAEIAASLPQYGHPIE